MAGEEQNTKRPTGGKGALLYTKKQIIPKGELPKQKGARGISVHEQKRNINKAGPSVPSKKRNRGCPSSGLSEQYREADDFTSFSIEMKPVVDCIEMDDSTSFSIEMKPMDDFIEMNDFTSSNAEMFGSMLDGQSPTLGGEEAIMNESPHYKMPMDDFIEMDDFTNFCTKVMPMDDFTSFNNELMPMDDFIEMADFTSFNTEMLQWEDYNDQSSLVHQHHCLNKLKKNKIIKQNKDHSN